MTDIQQIDVAYGRGSVPVMADPKVATWEVIRPTFEAALEKPERLFVEAVRNPIGSRPLRDLIEPGIGWRL